MLDTSFCVAVLRRRSAQVLSKLNEAADGACISSVTLMELLHGAAKSAKPADNRLEVLDFASRLEVLAFDEAAADHAGDIRATLERLGRPIGAYDTLIAGHARSLGLIVVTGNLGEFHRVDGLRSEDWMA